MLLFLDLESSALIRKELPLGDPLQPWMIRVSALHTDGAGKTLNGFTFTIKADGRKVKPGAGEVHGIDATETERIGVQEAKVLALLADLAGATTRVISYGDFDRLLIESLMIRLETKLGRSPGSFRMKWIRPGLEFVNVMTPAAQQACKLPSSQDWSDEYRWPSLQEAVRLILGRDPDRPVHDAWEDMMLLRDLYFALRERGHYDQGAE